MVYRKRHSLQRLSADPALQPELDKVIKAFAGIQAKLPSDPNSFYSLGGFHGEPFRGPITQFPGPKSTQPDEQDPAQKLWWGGYCNHGNVLFPTWHRAYMHRFEKALQSVEGCEDVMLPFWDECSEMENWDPYRPFSDTTQDNAPQVMPEILTREFVTIDGKENQRNPLFSYQLQRDTTYFRKATGNAEAEEAHNPRSSKPKGYETCRFPKRGIVCNSKERKTSDDWNAQFSNQSENNRLLNINIAHWLEGSIKIPKKYKGEAKKIRIPDTCSIYSRFQLCLQAPNYTVFSNATSEGQWKKDLMEREGDGVKGIENHCAEISSLETPHNGIHLAIGGFYHEGVYNANAEKYAQANGDMGDNSTASFDPIFFFHHAFIDYVFWTWQKRHGLTRRGDLDVLLDYPGTITDEASPVGLTPGSMLDMTTPLYPFRRPDSREWITSDDVTSIYDLDYDYGEGSLDRFADPNTSAQTFAATGLKDTGTDSKIVAIKRTFGINRAEIKGSFVMRTMAVYGDNEIEVGREAVLSRFNVSGCRNCQTHLEAESLFPMYRAVVDALGAPSEREVKYRIEIDTRDTAYGLVSVGSQQRQLPCEDVSNTLRLRVRL